MRFGWLYGYSLTTLRILITHFHDYFRKPTETLTQRKHSRRRTAAQKVSSRDSILRTPPVTIQARQWMACYGGYTLVTLPRIVTLYRDSVDGTHDRVTHQKLVTR